MPASTKLVLVAIVSAAIGASAVLAFEKPSSSPVNHMASSMEEMSAALQGKEGDTFDQAFLKEMIIHHEGAVEMANLARTNAGHVEIKQMAEAIISAQEAEIAQMKQWQMNWFGKASTSPEDGRHNTQ